MRRTPEDRFWAKVKKSRGCWEWTASCLQGGYGQFGLGSRAAGKDLAHRVSWRMHYGKIPDGMFICHKCDNRKCVRPSHLFLGTALDNILDMSQKGRWNGPRGENHPHSKLTHEKAREIKRLLADGMIVHHIAKKFGVNWTTIAQVRDRKTWKDA